MPRKTKQSEATTASTAATNAGNFKDHLKEISAILEWFDSQEELDVELALEKIKKAGELMKSSKKRLVEIENEFKEIRKTVED
jgi:exonuclease VII small subunit